MRKSLLFLFFTILSSIYSFSSHAGPKFFGVEFGSKVCNLSVELGDRTRAKEQKRLSTLTDDQLRAEAAALEATGTQRNFCRAAQTLATIIDRYPISETVEDADGNRSSIVVAKEPVYYQEVYLQTVNFLTSVKNYSLAAEMLKAFLARFQRYPNNDYVLFLLGETYTHRIPQDPRLDITAAIKGQSQFALLVSQFKETPTSKESPYRMASLERLKFIKLWLARHDLEVAKAMYNEGQYYPTLLNLIEMVLGNKRIPYVMQSETMAENFYYSCRAWLQIRDNKDAEIPNEALRGEAVNESEYILTEMRKRFVKSPWLAKAEQFCGLKGENPRFSPEFKDRFRRPERMILPAIKLPLDGKVPPLPPVVAEPTKPADPVPPTSGATPPSGGGAPTISLLSEVNLGASNE
jgi:outer membrane protein assembly factor BamD (BamD/ComL family)